MIGKPELADNKILVLIMSLVVFWALSFASMRGMKFGKYFTSVGALGSVVLTVSDWYGNSGSGSVQKGTKCI